MFETRETAIKRAGGATAELAETIATAVKQLAASYIIAAQIPGPYTHGVVAHCTGRVQNHKTKTAVTSA